MASLMPVAKQQYFIPGTAIPLVGGKLYTYAAGTSTLKTTYQDPAGTTPNTNPITLDSAGSALIYWDGAYKIILKDSLGNTVYTVDNYNADPYGVESLGGSSGSSLVGFIQSGSGAAKRTAQDKFRDVVSVKDFGAKGDGITDDTAAIQAAINSFPNQGTPTWQSWCLRFPNGIYKITSTINVKNQQFGRIIGDAASLIGNFNGPVLQVGDTSGTNDVLWFHIEGLFVQQNNTGASARAVVMQHAYSCTVDKCYFYGGQFAFVLDGNANLMTGCTFRGAITSNVTTGGGSNNEANRFVCCSNELSQGTGYDISVTSGTGGFTIIEGGYCENNLGGNISIKNAEKFKIDGVYFNLQNGAAGVILDGSVGARYPEPYGTVQQCRVLGVTSGTVPQFIKETGTTSINCAYANNEVESGSCDLYGAAEKSINLNRRRAFSYIANADTFVDADANGIPDGWTRNGSGAVTTAAAIGDYGGGKSVVVTATNDYIYQDVRFPANALLRVSVWAATDSDARIQLLRSDLGATFATASTVSATPVRLEFYLAPSTRSAATTAKLLLRNLSSSGINAQFCRIEIEDMTN